MWILPVVVFSSSFVSAAFFAYNSFSPVECVHVRVRLRTHSFQPVNVFACNHNSVHFLLLCDWERWFLNTIVVCSRYYFIGEIERERESERVRAHSSFKVQFCFCLYIHAILSYGGPGLKAFNIRLCSLAFCAFLRKFRRTKRDECKAKKQRKGK